MKVNFKVKLVGLIPDDKWDSKKRHLSALIKGGKVVRYSHCKLSGVPNCCNTRGRSCHSEMEVIKPFVLKNKDMSKYTIWNIRWTRKGEIVNSCPCYHCQQTLLKIGLTDVVYSCDDGTFEKVDLRKMKCNVSSGYRY